MLSFQGNLNNHKKEMQLESSMEKARRIPNSDCRPHESISHAYSVRSQSKSDKEYLIIFHRRNFITCDCPWSIRGNICKHSIKVDWFQSSLMDLDPLLDLHTTPNQLNAPFEIITEALNLPADTIPTNIEDDNVEELGVLREELFGYIDLLRNSPPSTAKNKKKLIDLAKKIVDDANNINIRDHDFTVDLGAYESSLKRKKSFLSPKKKKIREKKVASWKLI